MKRIFLSLILLLVVHGIHAQSIQSKIAKAYSGFMADPQLDNALVSLYVIDASTGRVVFDKNSGIGLAPASTQKIITSAAAYDILGATFRYETQLGYYGQLESGRLNGGIYILGSGDPTLGSWRWPQTREATVMSRFAGSINRSGIRSFDGYIIDETGWEAETIPGGWVWDDIGNYYGAGAGVLNWRENQYDLILRSGNETGSRVDIVGTEPSMYDFKINSHVTAAARGTGDNAYIYFPVGSGEAVVRGTIPVSENGFTISGAMPSSKKQFVSTLNDSLEKRGIQPSTIISLKDRLNDIPMPGKIQIIHTEYSPMLDSISYWFLKRSINLYGEALVKTMAHNGGERATTGNGADLVRDLWAGKNIGIRKTELNLHDGSGLSPLNRTTTHAQVMVLQYARKQPWFQGYFHGFPEYNKMKMKSGTISGVKGFCGYHTASNGKEYIFSFLVNNYNGSASALVQKMYKVLDGLK